MHCCKCPPRQGRDEERLAPSCTDLPRKGLEVGLVLREGYVGCRFLVVVAELRHRSMRDRDLPSCVEW